MSPKIIPNNYIWASPVNWFDAGDMRCKYNQWIVHTGSWVINPKHLEYHDFKV
jgi:hypothetical protein